MAAKPRLAFVCVAIIVFLFVICEGAPVPKHSGEHGHGSHEDHGKDHDGHGKDHDGHGKDHDGHGKDHDDKHKDHDSKEHGKHGDHEDHGKHGDHEDHGKHGDHGDHDEPKKTRDLIVPTPKEGPPPVIPDLHPPLVPVAKPLIQPKIFHDDHPVHAEPPVAPEPVAKPVEHSSVGEPVSPEPMKTKDLVAPTPKEGPPPVIHEIPKDALVSPTKDLVLATPKEGEPPVVHDIHPPPGPVVPKMPAPPKIFRDEHPVLMDKPLIRTTRTLEGFSRTTKFTPPVRYFDTKRTTPRFTIHTTHKTSPTHAEGASLTPMLPKLSTAAVFHDDHPVHAEPETKNLTPVTAKEGAPPTPMIPKPPSPPTLAHDDHPVHAEPETKNLTLATPKEAPPPPKALETKDIPKKA